MLYFKCNVVYLQLLPGQKKMLFHTIQYIDVTLVKNLFISGAIYLNINILADLFKDTNYNYEIPNACWKFT